MQGRVSNPPLLRKRRMEKRNSQQIERIKRIYGGDSLVIMSIKAIFFEPQIKADERRIAQIKRKAEACTAE